MRGRSERRWYKSVEDLEEWVGDWVPPVVSSWNFPQIGGHFGLDRFPV